MKNIKKTIKNHLPETKAVCLDPQETLNIPIETFSSKVTFAGLHSEFEDPIPSDPCSPNPQEYPSPLS